MLRLKRRSRIAKSVFTAAGESICKEGRHDEAKVVTKNARVIGHSSTEWPIATIVRLPGSRIQTIFEPVTKHHNSVAHAAMKFHDIALLGKAAPSRVAVVHNKQEFGTFLQVLSQSASVIGDDVANSTILCV